MICVLSIRFGKPIIQNENKLNNLDYRLDYIQQSGPPITQKPEDIRPTHFADDGSFALSLHPQAEGGTSTILGPKLN